MVSAVGEGYPPCPYRALPARIFNAQSRSKGSIPMRRLLLLSFGLSLFALPSRAQSVDASVGYSYFRLGAFGGINQNGVSGSVAYNPNRRSEERRVGKECRYRVVVDVEITVDMSGDIE